MRTTAKSPPEHGPGDGEPVELHYGWVMVAITPLFVGLGNGGLSSLSVFLKPLSAEFGWLRGQTAFAYTAGTFAMGVGGVLMGHLADRYSTRAVVVPGILTLGASYLALASLTSLWHLWALYVLLGAVGAGAMMSPLLANVGSWFRDRKGLALGLTTSGLALAAGGVPYVSAYLIASFGWRRAYAALGIAALAVLLPLSRLIRESRSSQATREMRRATNRDEETFRVRPACSISLLSVAAVFCCITMSTPLIHVVALASDHGMSSESSARVLLLIMVAGIFGRIFFGRLADRIGGLPAYIVASAWQTAVVFWFSQVHSPVALQLLAIVFGFGYSGVMTCLVYCAQRFVPATHGGVATGVVTLFGWIGMGLGGLQAGYLFDWTGSYSRAFANAAFSGMVNLAILTFLLVLQRRHAPAPTTVKPA